MRKPILQNLKECDFYDKQTHKCLADGSCICVDPLLVREEECETAREAANVKTKSNTIYSFFPYDCSATGCL